MMKRRIYSIRDKKAGVYNGPCLFDNDAVAMRAFGDLVLRDKENPIAVHPSDYSLCCLGEMDMLTGALFILEGGISVLCDADAFAKE